MIKNYFLLLLLGVQTAVGVNNWDNLLNNFKVQPRESAFVSRPVAEEVLKGFRPTEEAVNFQQKIADLGITLHPGTDFTKDSENPTKSSLDHCSALIYGVLKVMPAEVTDNLKDMTLYFSDEGRRGLGGGSTIILRCQNVTDRELVGVFVHELGHIMDTGVIKGDFWSGESEFRDGKNAIFNDDKSLDFYRISFENDKTLNKTATSLDFVSGYAKTDPFEDFAETYNYYLLHGDNFREMAEYNTALGQKYDFMKENVFNGQEFNFESEPENGLLTGRDYDTTVIGYNLQKFLAF